MAKRRDPQGSISSIQTSRKKRLDQGVDIVGQMDVALGGSKSENLSRFGGGDEDDSFHLIDMEDFDVGELQHKKGMTQTQAVDWGNGNSSLILNEYKKAKKKNKKDPKKMKDLPPVADTAK